MSFQAPHTFLSFSQGIPPNVEYPDILGALLNSHNRFLPHPRLVSSSGLIRYNSRYPTERTLTVQEKVRSILFSSPIAEHPFLVIYRSVPRQTGDVFSLVAGEERETQQSPDLTLSHLMQQRLLRPLGEAEGGLSNGTPQQTLAGIDDEYNAQRMALYLGIDEETLENALHHVRQEAMNRNPLSSFQDYSSPVELNLLDVAVVDTKDGVGEIMYSRLTLTGTVLVSVGRGRGSNQMRTEGYLTLRWYERKFGLRLESQFRTHDVRVGMFESLAFCADFINRRPDIFDV